jgi:hypothetical protein
MLERLPPDDDDARVRERRTLAQRRYRANKRKHFVISPVKVGPLLLDYLVRVVHWLPESDAGDARKIGEAITRGLTESAEAKRP